MFKLIQCSAHFIFKQISYSPATSIFGVQIFSSALCSDVTVDEATCSKVHTTNPKRTYVDVNQWPSKVQRYVKTCHGLSPMKCSNSKQNFGGGGGEMELLRLTCTVRRTQSRHTHTQKANIRIKLVLNFENLVYSRHRGAMNW
jgi:hypothetical protein